MSERILVIKIIGTPWQVEQQISLDVVMQNRTRGMIIENILANLVRMIDSQPVEMIDGDSGFDPSKWVMDPLGPEPKA